MSIFSKIVSLFTGSKKRKGRPVGSKTKKADWITPSGSLKKNYKYPYKGEFRTINEISKLSGIKVCTICARLHAGWKLNKAFYVPADTTRYERMAKGKQDRPLILPYSTEPKRNRLPRSGEYEALGTKATIKEWSQKSLIPEVLLRRRIKMGLNMEQALRLSHNPRK